MENEKLIFTNNSILVLGNCYLYKLLNMYDYNKQFIFIYYYNIV